MENIVVQTISGILTGIALLMLRSLWLKIRKLSRAKTMNEITNISFNIIITFSPTIASLLVLACEIWLISPRNIIDIIFIFLAVYSMIGNFVYAYLVEKIKEVIIEMVDLRSDHKIIMEKVHRITTAYDTLKAENEELKKRLGE